MLSVVIPTFNASATLPATLAALGAGADEIVVCDGGSTDDTVRTAAALGARVVTAMRGRGVQLVAGIAEARGDWLLLLHADTVLADGWADAARRVMAVGTPCAGYFRFALASGDPRARRLERLVAWRCRMFGLPYGDQGLLASRGLLAAVGGVRPLPLMEDVDLVRRTGAGAVGGVGGGCGDVGGAVGAGRVVAALGAQPDLPVAVFRPRAAGLDCQDVCVTDVVYVFARAPRLGTVKRRLAAGIGAMAALAFYRATLGATMRRLARDRRFRTMVAVTPDRAGGPWRLGLPWVAQRGGDLGARMHRVMRRHRGGRVAIVGADIPGLRADDVATAFRRLRAADACFGPAADGGLLVGGAGSTAAFAAICQCALVIAARAGRYTGQFRRTVGCDAANAARCRYGRRSCGGRPKARRRVEVAFLARDRATFATRHRQRG